MVEGGGTDWTWYDCKLAKQGATKMQWLDKACEGELWHGQSL